MRVRVYVCVCASVRAGVCVCACVCVPQNAVPGVKECHERVWSGGISTSDPELLVETRVICHLEEQNAELGKHIVFRPLEADQFSRLYRDIHTASRTMFNIEKILDIMNSVRSHPRKNRAATFAPTPLPTRYLCPSAVSTQFRRRSCHQSSHPRKKSRPSAAPPPSHLPHFLLAAYASSTKHDAPRSPS